MPPKFATALAWEQANLMMQPALIRVIDNIRKHLDEAEWTGTYENVLRFPPGTSSADQARVQSLQIRLEAGEGDREDLQQQLAQLPQPYLGYELCLSQGDRQVRVDLWELCYKVCFRAYEPSPDPQATQLVEIDETLVNDQNELDWQRLEEKAQQVVALVFDTLSLD